MQVDILFWDNCHPKIGCNVFKKKLLDVQVPLFWNNMAIFSLIGRQVIASIFMDECVNSHQSI